MDKVKGSFRLAKFDYIIGFAVSIALLIILGACLVIAVQRIFDMLMLYLISPYFVATMPLDDGEKFGIWRNLFIGKCFSGIGMVVAMKLYIMLCPVIMNTKLLSFSSKSDEMDYLTRLIFLLGGAWAVYKSGHVVTEILSQSAAAGETGAAMVGGGTVIAAFHGGAGLATSGIERLRKKDGEGKTDNKKAGNAEKSADEKQAYQGNGNTVQLGTIPGHTASAHPGGIPSAVSTAAAGSGAAAGNSPAGIPSAVSTAAAGSSAAAGNSPAGGQHVSAAAAGNSTTDTGTDGSFTGNSAGGISGGTAEERNAAGNSTADTGNGAAAAENSNAGTDQAGEPVKNAKVKYQRTASAGLGGRLGFKTAYTSDGKKQILWAPGKGKAFRIGKDEKGRTNIRLFGCGVRYSGKHAEKISLPCVSWKNNQQGVKTVNKISLAGCTWKKDADDHFLFRDCNLIGMHKTVDKNGTMHTAIGMLGMKKETDAEGHSYLSRIFGKEVRQEKGSDGEYHITDIFGLHREAGQDGKYHVSGLERADKSMDLSKAYKNESADENE